MNRKERRKEVAAAAVFLFFLFCSVFFLMKRRNECTAMFCLKGKCARVSVCCVSVCVLQMECVCITLL